MKNSFRTFRLSASALAFASVVGCSTFQPIPADSVMAGMSVRVEMSRPEAARQAEFVGELDEIVEGKVTEQSTEALLSLSIPSRGFTPASGPGFRTLLSLPWAAVEQVEGKRFSLGRTALLAAIGAVAAVAILSISEGGTTPGDGEGPPVDTDIISIVLRFHP